MIYRSAGDGPVILLVHGLLDSSRTWRKLAPVLALGHTVIAPDLLGHGESDGPTAVDYSLGGHAGMLRDLLDELGHERVTVVGHSLGGGIAMTFAYHYPERVERLALISSGGLGRGVSPALRAATLPGAGAVMRTVGARPVVAAGRALSALLGGGRAPSPGPHHARARAHAGAAGRLRPARRLPQHRARRHRRSRPEGLGAGPAGHDRQASRCSSSGGRTTT